MTTEDSAINTGYSVNDVPLLPPPLKHLRYDLISNAVKFLTDDSVKAAPLSKKIAFMMGKGLSKEEIDLALIKADIIPISETIIN